MARNLASIQRIVALDPIPGADKILHAQVLGWKCITAIDNGFKVNDLVIYVEVDSRLPADNPAFAFMEKRGYKVKTIKMRGVYSQGLILPLNVIKDLVTTPIELAEGIDITEILKVTKIDTDEPGEKVPNNFQNQHPIDRWLCKFKLWHKVRHYILPKKEKGWPEEIPHTDETRIQSIWNTIEPYLQTKKWYISTKIDGQSATYYYKKKRFGKDFFGLYSRTLRKKEDDNSNWAQMATKYKIKEHCKNFCKSLGLNSVWIQGEIAGPGIQKNKNHFLEKRLFIFNVFIPKWNRYLFPQEMEILFTKGTNMDLVPLKRTEIEISLSGKTIDDIVKMSNGPSEWSKNDLREGIVIREMENYGLDRITFKIISPDFLIKYGL
jgi:hypothetical protein